MAQPKLYDGVTRHEWGKTNIGGSDVAAILGKSDFKTALDVYLEKTGQKEQDPPTRKMEVGTIMEESIRAWIADDLNRPVYEGRMFRHDSYHFIAANTDGELDKDTLLEIKTTSFHTRSKWGEEGTDQIPVDYYIQVQWYMGIGRYDRSVVAKVDTGTWEIAYYMVEFQADLFAVMVERVVEFWEALQSKTPPAPTAKDGSNIVYLFPESNGEIAISTPEIDKVAEEMKSLYPTWKQTEKRYKDLESQIKVAIGENDGIQTSVGQFKMIRQKGAVSWKAVAEHFNPTAELIESNRGKDFAKVKPPFDSKEDN